VSYAALGCRLALILVFATSGLSKVRRHAFADLVRMLRTVWVVPVGLARTAGVALVASELGIAAALATGLGTPTGFAGAALLLALFTLLIAVAIRRRATVACRCFGTGGTPLGAAHLVRNVLLFAVAGGGFWVQQQEADVAHHPGGVAVTLAAGAAVAALLIRFDELVDLFAARPTSTVSRAPTKTTTT